MSNDLINRSALIDELKQSGMIVDNDYGNAMVDFIKNLPTAYDVDKVVEQLEKCKEIMKSPISRDCFEKECACSDCTVCCFDKAIEIVKAGGKDE